MGKPAARMGDMHVCPMVTPGVPPVPHVGGPLTGPGAPTVLIGSMPAATLGDIAVCVGPPSTIILGSMGVMLGGKPAARMGDLTAHGGTITLGLPTVLIGEMSPSALAPAAAMAMAVPGAAAVVAEMLDQLSGAGHAIAKQVVAFVEAAASGIPLVHNSCSCSECNRQKPVRMSQAPEESSAPPAMEPETAALIHKQNTGSSQAPPPSNVTPENKVTRDSILCKLVDEEGLPVPGIKFAVTLPDNKVVKGSSNSNGEVFIKDIEPGTCKVEFPELHSDEWQQS